MALQAVLHVGLSFANVGLFENKKLVASQRFYLPQEPLKNSLKKFWLEKGTPKDLTVSSRYLERILDAKLGGTVAQIVTAGFETWPVLCQPVLPEHFDLSPHRQDALASQELIFGLSERVSAKGEALSPIKTEELEFILAKLKLMSVKRVCVNLLFAGKNPKHQAEVCAFFKSHEFEVFASERSIENSNEMPTWRKNILNACLSGAFTEHIEDIQKSFGEEKIEIQFLDAAGDKFVADANRISASMFAWSTALNHEFKNRCDDLLYLGIENWSLISMHEKSPSWVSPWGSIELASPATLRLRTQPSLEISNSLGSGVQISENELGFEPGPMTFGRAQKTMLFDILVQKFSIEQPQIQAQGVKRLHDQITAMIKIIPELSGLQVASLMDLLVDQVVFRLGLELQFKSPGKKILVTGFFAASLFPLLQKRFPQLKLELDKEAPLCALNSIGRIAEVL